MSDIPADLRTQILADQESDAGLRVEGLGVERMFTEEGEIVRWQLTGAGFISDSLASSLLGWAYMTRLGERTHSDLGYASIGKVPGSAEWICSVSTARDWFPGPTPLAAVVAAYKEASRGR